MAGTTARLSGGAKLWSPVDGHREMKMLDEKTIAAFEKYCPAPVEAYRKAMAEADTTLWAREKELKNSCRHDLGGQDMGAFERANPNYRASMVVFEAVAMDAKVEADRVLAAQIYEWDKAAGIRD